MWYDKDMDKKEIKRLREMMGLSQQKFATKLGVGIVTVNRWESGKTIPSSLAEEKLIRMSKRYS